MIEFLPSREVAFELMGYSIHWYGVMYLTAFILAFILIPRLQKYRQLDLSRDDIAQILSWAIVGVIAGGRLGYVLFYQPMYFLNNPAEIIAVWHGGMSSHGGFIGVAIALFFILKKKQVPILRFADSVMVPVAIGLALGRVGNYINQEIIGTVTSLPWGIEFAGIEGIRHPVQLYAVGKDLLLAALCYWCIRKTRTPGNAFSLFLVGYAVLRFSVEFVRVQEHELILNLTRGQLLTLPILLAGCYVWLYISQRRRLLR